MARPSDAPTFTTAIPIFRTKFSYVLFLSKYLLQTPSQIIVTLRLTTACTPCYIWGYKLLGINVVFFFVPAVTGLINATGTNFPIFVWRTAVLGDERNAWN